MFKKLRNNMVIFNMISIALIILTAFSVIYFVTYRNIERANRRQLQALKATPLKHLYAGGTPERFGTPSQFSADYRVSFILFVNNGKIEIIYSYLDFENHVYEEALAEIGSKTDGKVSTNGRKWAFARQYVSFGIAQYEKIVFLDITNGTQTLRDLLITLSCVGFVVLSVILWLSYRFAIRAVSPIEESYQKQKQFIADASHELKTPLAVINANIDAIETSGNESVESQKEWFGYIRAELNRTGKLVDDLLYLAKAENISYAKDVPFNISRACEIACASMEAILYENEIRLDTEIEDNINIYADGEKITQVLYILLDNAGKYTPKHGRVRVSLGIENDRVVIRVSNTGEMIPSEDLPKIFDRFYRSDESRSRETGGFGLGLSIAKTIIERSGGEIFAESTGGYNTFTIKLNK